MDGSKLGTLVLTVCIAFLVVYIGSAVAQSDDIYLPFVGNDSTSMSLTSLDVVAATNGGPEMLYACANINSGMLTSMVDPTTGSCRQGEEMISWARTDTLGELSCSSGQVAKWAGSQWVCAEDVDTDTNTDTLVELSCSEGQIAKMVGGQWTCANTVTPDDLAAATARLDDLESRVAVLESVRYPPPALTGQTQCWDSGGGLINCLNTGQDGEYQYGSEPPVAPAVGYDFGNYDRTTILARASDPGFVDNSDGTVTDNLTGLTWLKNADCFGGIAWQNALDAANGLADGNDNDCGLSDGSSVGEWRVPNINELRSLFHRNRSSNQYLPTEHPFTGVQSSPYWSSTSKAATPNYAWVVLVYNSKVGGIGKDGLVSGVYVWPVRGGQ